MKKFILILVSILATQNVFCQLLPTAKIKFKNFEAWSRVDNQLFGKKIKSGNAITKFDISTMDDRTYISGESSLLGGTFSFEVNSTEIDSKSGVDTYITEATQLMNDKKMKMLLNYQNNILMTFFIILDNQSGIIKFYNDEKSVNKNFANNLKKCFTTADFIDLDDKKIINTKENYNNICARLLNENKIIIEVNGEENILKIEKTEFLENVEHNFKTYKATTHLGSDKYEIIYLKGNSSLTVVLIWIKNKYVPELNRKVIVQYNKE